MKFLKIPQKEKARTPEERSPFSVRSLWRRTQTSG